MSKLDNLKPPSSRPGSWTSRTVMVLVPLHLLAFLALYFGAMRIVRGEILRTHSRDARVTLNEAVRDLHPLMVLHDENEARERLRSFIGAHDLLDLRLFDANGVEAGASPTDPLDGEVRQFLAMDDTEWFQFEESDDKLTLHGMMRLNSEPACQQCHPPNRLIGVASMHLDMTPQVADAHARMGRHIAGLIAVWVLVVAALNIVAGRYVRRSVARLEAGIGGDVVVPSDPSTEMGKMLLDPTSVRLYEALEKVMTERQEREVQVSSRLHHTERLASLGQLAAGLAHEIKNPLAGIHGVLELLRDESNDETKTKLYEDMVAELDRVNATIHSLLNFARPAPANRVPTDMRQLVENTVKLMQPSLTKRSIRVVTEISSDLGSTDVDPDQIRQVLVNLIGNAADAIDRKGTITVRAAHFLQGEGLMLAVEDEGQGISEEELGRIFEPFYTTKFSGTGLGLSVVRSLVDKHGGRVDVQSEVGKGTTFLVVLPAVAEAADGSDEVEG